MPRQIDSPRMSSKLAIFSYISKLKIQEELCAEDIV